MRNALSILAELNDDDLAWLVEISEVQEFASGKTLIHAGRRIDAIYILLEGEVEIVLPEGARVDKAGPGEVIGEMSLIEAAAPSVVVHSLTELRALVVPQAALSERAAADPAFGCRLYRALSRYLSSRLRAHHRRLMYGIEPVEPAGPEAAQADAERQRQFRRLTALMD